MMTENAHHLPLHYNFTDIMSTAIISTIVGLICTSLSSLVTFLFTRRKYNEEVNSQQLKNTDGAFELFKKMTDETMTLQNQKIEQLQKENEALRRQVNDLQMQVASLLGRISYDETHTVVKKKSSASSHKKD